MLLTVTHVVCLKYIQYILQKEKISKCPNKHIHTHTEI